MSENIKNVLHNEDGLEVVFLVDEAGARVEFRANLSFDLSTQDDVICVVNGQGMPVDCQSADFAVAQLGNPEDISRPTQLMVRVGEFFEGWELD